MIPRQLQNEQTIDIAGQIRHRTEQKKEQKNQITFLALALSLTRRLHYRLTKQPLPFPTIFQIQTNTLCNGSCIMCPLSQEKHTQPGWMSDELFEKIIKEISENKTKDTLVWLHLQNEPLTDDSIFNKIKLIKKISNGLIQTGLVTNGTLLTEEKIKELNTSGLDRICFSIDASTKKTYNTIRKGLDYDTVLHNIETLRKSKSKTQIFVRFIWQKENYHELLEFRNYWKKKGIPQEIGVVNNRAGTVSNFKDIGIPKGDIPFRYRLIQNMWSHLTKGCYHLANSFNILYNGDVILCCNDYRKKTTLGNVQNTSIKEIWASKKYQSIREAIFNHDFEKIPECKQCSEL